MLLGGTRNFNSVSTPMSSPLCCVPGLVKPIQTAAVLRGAAIPTRASYVGSTLDMLHNAEDSKELAHAPQKAGGGATDHRRVSLRLARLCGEAIPKPY